MGKAWVAIVGSAPSMPLVGFMKTHSAPSPLVLHETGTGGHSTRGSMVLAKKQARRYLDRVSVFHEKTDILIQISFDGALKRGGADGWESCDDVPGGRGSVARQHERRRVGGQVTQGTLKTTGTDGVVTEFRRAL